MDQNDFIAIGKIAGAHGVKGNIKVVSYSGVLDVLEMGNTLYVRSSQGDFKSYLIQWSQPYKKIALLTLKGVDDRDQAQELIGAELFIDKRKLPETEEDTWYWFDLIGLSVFTIDEQYLGKIKNVFDTGSNDVFEVHDQSKRKNADILIPALKSVVVEVDLTRRVMRVDLPEGLV